MLAQARPLTESYQAPPHVDGPALVETVHKWVHSEWTFAEVG